jgi:hypothetical protein
MRLFLIRTRAGREFRVAKPSVATQVKLFPPAIGSGNTAASNFFLKNFQNCCFSGDGEEILTVIFRRLYCTSFYDCLSGLVTHPGS